MLNTNEELLTLIEPDSSDLLIVQRNASGQEEIGARIPLSKLSSMDLDAVKILIGQMILDKLDLTKEFLS